MEAAIQCSGLVKHYGPVVALAGLDLTVPRGVIYGFLGPNGAGKTTAIRILTGLDRATAGKANVAGFDVSTSGTEMRQRIGYLSQEPHFYSWMTGRETLNFIGNLFGLQGKVLKERVDLVLDQAGLTDVSSRRVGGYSGGMVQRLGLAQALVNNPDVLLLDEPASSLDPAGRRDILQIIEGLRGRATVFMSTHILADVERVCDHVAIINKGLLVVESSITDLQAQYAQPVFILEPERGQEEGLNALKSDLERQPWSKEVIIMHGELRVIASDTAEASRGILPLVAQHNMELARFERARPSLEDIFLRLVGQAPDAGEEQRR